MRLNYEIVRYKAEFKKQVVELQTHLWSPSLALNTAYFEWKYERNPYLDEPLVYLALFDGKVVGMRGFFGVQWEAGFPSQKFRGLYADDLVIAPGHRDRGLISKIMTAAFKDLARGGHQYVFNLSGRQVTFLASLSMGWRSAGSVQVMRRQCWRSVFQSRLQQFMKRLPLLWRYADRLVFPRSKNGRRSHFDTDRDRVKRQFKDAPWISIESSPRCGAMADVVERIGSDGRIRHVRDREYFEWRFQNPLSRYCFLFWEKSRFEGYLVVKESTSEFANKEVVNIVDLEATRAQVRADLLDAAVNRASKSDLMIWSTDMSGETNLLLDKNGFKPVKQAEGVNQYLPAVLVRPIRTELLEGDWLLGGRRLLDLASWDLRMLYSMNG
jgi:GNAT superfamily N-acetyltransferase